VEVVRQGQRHIGQLVAHRNRLQIDDPIFFCGFVGGQAAVLARREREVLLLEFLPNRLVNALRIVRRGGKQINDQELTATLSTRMPYSTAAKIY
jgi:hypothetical protein